MEQQHDGVMPGEYPADDADRRPAVGTVRSAVRRSAAAGAAGAATTGPQGDMYNAFGQGFARAFELAVTPVLFGAMGYGLDRWLGTLPVFTAVLSVVTLITMLLRTWYGYCYRMEALEASGPWAKRTQSQLGGSQ